MGEIDVRTNEYMGENEHFADVFNYYFYGGKQVVKPEDLRELDRTSVSILYGNDGKSSEINQKYRDVVKMLSAKTNGKATFLLLGIEDQTSVHYAMPVRDMLYDANSYMKQVKDIEAAHRRNGEYGAKGEFISGFHKDDKLHPVVTLVIYWSHEKWDGPKSLHEMLDIEDAATLRLVQDYKINLITPEEMQDIDFTKFKTALSDVFQYIKYSKNRIELDRILMENPHFKHLDRESAELINAVTDSKLRFEEGKEEVNMCAAITEMKQMSEAKIIMQTVEHMVRVKGMTVAEACDMAGYTEQQYLSARKLMEKEPALV